MNRAGKSHALLATARVANIPSVISNVWLGVAMGALSDFSGVGNSGSVPWSAVCRLMLAGVSLYVAGNFLNDWMDRKWDTQHRPERALPRGLFQPGQYLGAAVVAGAAGLLLAAWVGWLAALVAVGIAVNVMVYTAWHKRSAWAVVPMGLCRALLPGMGAAGMTATSDVSKTLLLAALGGSGLFCHIVGLSLSARSESAGSLSADQRKLPLLFPVLAILFLLAAGFLSDGSWLLLIGPVPYVAWLVVCHTGRRRPISKHVSSLLAGIPLVDWIYLLPASLHASGLPIDHALWVGCFAIPPLAFVSALLLQRLAPAT